MAKALPIDPERYVSTSRPGWWHHPAALNTDAVVTFAARPGQRHAVYKPLWSYDDTPVGQIQAYSGGQLIWGPMYITSGGPGFIPVLIVGKLGQNLVLRLDGGGAAVTGSVGVEKYFPHVG